MATGMAAVRSGSHTQVDPIIARSLGEDAKDKSPMRGGWPS